MDITKEQLKKWGACVSGTRWFLEKFPQGADYADVHKALRQDKRFDDASWLANRAFETAMTMPAVTAKITEVIKNESRELIEQTKLTVEVVKVDPKEGGNLEASSGDAARIGSSGYAARIGSSGDAARIGSSGDAARIGSSGNAARIGSSGNAARIGSSGDDARIGSSGDDARINATGKNASVACVGVGSRAKAADGGFIALSWFDEGAQRPRITVGYVGENIKADTWYSVSGAGELVEEVAE